MAIHHLNCGSMRPPFAKMASIVYCLLVETTHGLVLIDTGFGTRDCHYPTRIMRFFAAVIGAKLDINETAVRQVEKLGYGAQDVKHIVLTHLHLDHTGGLADFPAAQVHVWRTEYETLRRPKGLIERGHDAAHWAHSPKWVFHDTCNREWYGFQASNVIKGLAPEILLIPLPGHTRGHCGVAVATKTGWLLQCGDAASPYYPDADPNPNDERLYALGAMPQWVVRRAIGPQVPRLRQLVRQHGPELQVISSHDIHSFQAHQQRKKGADNRLSITL